MASFLDGDALFVCFADINALGDLSQVLAALNVDEVAVALDMDKLTNWRVRKALQSIDDIVSTHLVQTGSQSTAIMERWILRIQGLEQKKKHYEEILQRELSDLDSDFTSLRDLCEELQIRARGLRFQKQQRAA